MSVDNDPIPEPAIFSAILTPYRSLGSAGFFVLMAAVSLISFVAGMVFLIAGAWPVFGFFFLDVLLIYWAFRASYSSAAAYEQVTVTASELRVRKVSSRGKVREWTFNPLWVRLDREGDPEFGLSRLFLLSQGQRLPVAGFLGPDERESFAVALACALGEARRGPTRTIV
ncbi:MAG TPA: DUF2244 domain-containing protein [Xanthobacteraceae bacterium]|nr:DUF2244 domain-containing protein [Xanthobacteraceae bacterium]